MKLPAKLDDKIIRRVSTTTLTHNSIRIGIQAFIYPTCFNASQFCIQGLLV
jgi:hypothetical protein